MSREGFNKKPKFLSEKQLLAIKRDTCVFCNEKFEGEDREIPRVYRSRGDHYGGDIEEEYFDMVYDITDEIYCFTFSLDKQTASDLLENKYWFLEKRKKEIQKEAEELENELNQTINLKGNQKETAVAALVKEHLSQLEKKREVFLSDKPSPLEITVGGFFHNLQFGDLALACTNEKYHDASRGSKHTHIVGYPVGLKSHLNCWPFKAPNVENSNLKLDVKDYSFEFQTKFRDFSEALRGNSTFVDYSELFKHHKDLKEFWGYALDLDITVKATNHRSKLQ